MKQKDKKPEITVIKGGAPAQKSSGKQNISNPVKLKDAHAVGKRIKYYRERQGLEQKDVALAVGITSNAVSNWENGRARPDFSVVPTLCEVLEITLYELYGIDNPLNTYTTKEQAMISDYRGLNLGHQLTVNNLISSLKTAEFAGNSPEVIKLIFCEKQLAAGFDGGAEFEDEGEPIYLYPHTNSAIRQADLVFVVNGDSMEPACPPVRGGIWCHPTSCGRPSGRPCRIWRRLPRPLCALRGRWPGRGSCSGSSTKPFFR